MARAVLGERASAAGTGRPFEEHGDLKILQWTTESGGSRLDIVVHYTDAVHAYAYDRESKVGRLDKAVATAALDRWILVNMKRGWKIISLFEKC